jgi:hypothetical protein
MVVVIVQVSGGVVDAGLIAPSVTSLRVWRGPRGDMPSEISRVVFEANLGPVCALETRRG